MKPNTRLTRWREDTPGWADRIHLNNAGAALMTTPVLSAIQDHLALESRIGGYEAAEREQTRIDRWAARNRGCSRLDLGGELCAIVTAEVPGRSPTHLRDWLRARGINTTAQSRADAVLDMDSKEAPSLIRLSPHYYNTEEEVSRAIEAVRKYLDRFPPTSG